MISIINYIEAKRRLKQSAETIEMMGGQQHCNEMILAQHEMIYLEKEYYKNKSYMFVFGLCVIVMTVFLFFNFFKVF